MRKQAEANLALLTRKSCVGDGIVIGLDQTGGNLVQVYWIMGGGPRSRNRVLEYDNKNSRVYTDIADRSLLEEGENTSLILYNAMRAEILAGGMINRAVVSNGGQTDEVWSGFFNGRDLYTTMRQYEYGDAPNFTPRITAECHWWPNGSPSATMSIVRKSLWSEECDRNLYEFGDLGRGFGYCLTAYSGDGDPLPSFRGEPYLLPLNGGIYEVANMYWEALDEKNRVSLVVKFISKRGRSETLIRNKYEKVET